MRDDYRSEPEICKTATMIINHEIDIIEGIRRIFSLKFDSNHPDDPVFLPITAVHSDTIHFPSEETKENFSEEYLQELENEKQKYLSVHKKDIISYCEELIKKFYQ